MDTSSLCQYASKPCTEPRSTKDSGELHRLCAFHRAKANDAQRRWHARQQTDGGFRAKRSRKIATPNASTKRRPTSVEQRTITMPAIAIAREAPVCDSFSAEDLALLDEFFHNADEDDVGVQHNWWLDTQPVTIVRL